ncbi:bardet-Biedl syndrome 1 protein [Caerostris darwini]|uniref:Bardet-Biedl syndrome 1 protein n=1 Tax=Caerostris darwini TaxID=1538125 RepID=A0AAV4RAQ7_9ARAC|nr:bardet-Biedl syndrome 1 protein [Caerostris darwini]
MEENLTHSSENESSKWLHAHYDPLATLYTFSSCMCLADLHGDGDYKLIVADLGTGTHNMKLKVYKGTHLFSEHTIIDLPTGVVSFHMDTCDPRSPAIAVASGAHIYIYKNMRPFYKFTLPAPAVCPSEMEAWAQAKNEEIDINTLREFLENIRAEVGESSLTARSQRFLMLEQDELDEFFQLHKQFPLKKQTVVTSLSAMKKSMAEEDAVSCLVLGTENQNVYVLEPDAFTILSAMTVPSVPVFMDVSGLFDVEFRIVVACRDGCLYTLKRGYKSARFCVKLKSQCVGLQRINNSIIVGTMDDMLSSYNNKGKCLWSIKLPTSIVTLESVDINIMGMRLVAVTLGNGLIHFYQDKFLVDVLAAEDVVSAVRFGRFGREDNSLVMCMRGGGLCVKILKRTAKFEIQDSAATVRDLQNTKLNLPKKTKLFVDQTMREREHSVIMHRAFQHDLYRLRLTTARSYVNALTSSQNPVSYGAIDPLKLSAQVQGLGPKFILHLELQNTSRNKPSINLFLTFHCDARIYKIQKTYIPISFLAPGLPYTFVTPVECVSEMNISDIIKVFVLKQGQNIPIITAMINMPVSEGFQPM